MYMHVCMCVYMCVCVFKWGHSQRYPHLPIHSLTPQSHRPQITKYQGVKEFHMLAHISCYCKIMVFSPFELGDTYCQSSKGNK